MRFRCIILTAAAWLSACSSGLAQGQPGQLGKQKNDPDQAKPGNLEQLIAEALKHNPDIRVADSKVREADAELNRTRMKVVSDITFLHAEIQAAQAMVEYAKKQYERTAELHKSGAIEARMLGESGLALEKAKADLASKKAKLPYLLGKSSSTTATMGLLDEFIRNKWHDAHADAKLTDEEFMRRVMLDIQGRLPTVAEAKDFFKLPEKDRREKWVDQVLRANLNYVPHSCLINVQAGRGCTSCHRPTTRTDVEQIWKFHFSLPETPQSDRLRKTLDAKVSLELRGHSSMAVLEHVREKFLAGINVSIRAKVSKTETLDVRLIEPVATGAALQFLEDELNVIFVLRDYGIVIVAGDERLPPGAVRVVDFWKQGKPQDKQSPETDKTKTPPPEKSKTSAAGSVRGTIARIDSTDPSLVELSIGSDDALLKGSTLEVFRLWPEPKFLGRVQVVNVQSARSVARRVSSYWAPMRAGDQITANLP